MAGIPSRTGPRSGPRNGGPDPGAFMRLGRALTRKPPFPRRQVAVPADLGRTKERAQACHVAWTRWLGPSELQFTQRSQAGR